MKDNSGLVGLIFPLATPQGHNELLDFIGCQDYRALKRHPGLSCSQPNHSSPSLLTPAGSMSLVSCWVEDNRSH